MIKLRRHRRGAGVDAVGAVPAGGTYASFRRVQARGKVEHLACIKRYKIKIAETRILVRKASRP